MAKKKHFHHLLKDGSFLSLLFGAFTSLTLLLKPELWVNDYRFHLTAALPALPLMILPSLVIAALTYGRSSQNITQIQLPKTV